MPAAELEYIGAKCEGITHLAFSEFLSGDQRAAIEALCLRYGNQLECLKLEWMNLSTTSLYRIVKACPNTEIQMYSQADIATNSMVAMGKAAKKRILVPQRKPRDNV